MKHRDKMNVLESPKSDETELVPISSNKINIQGWNFTKKMVIYGFFISNDPKSFFRKNQNKSCLYQRRFLKWFLMKSLRLIYLMIFAYFMTGIMDRPDRNLIFLLGEI